MRQQILRFTHVSDISKYNTLPFMLTFTVIIFVVMYLVSYIHRTWLQTESNRCRRNCCKICRYPRRAHQDAYLYGSRMHYGTCRIRQLLIKVGSVTSTAGNQLETQIMIALVLGGMPVNGGAKVKFYNIILGVMTYKVLSSGLVMLMMPTQLQQLILGSDLPGRGGNVQ